VVSVGIGLGIGIPGIVKMARQSEEETEAVNRYQDSVSIEIDAALFTLRHALSSDLTRQDIGHSDSFFVVLNWSCADSRVRECAARPLL